MEQQNASASRRSSIFLLAAVALLSAAGLSFEIALTRIFSATIWYHYAFVAISVALFGWGLGGFLVYVLGLAKTPERLGAWLVALSIVMALAIPLFPAIILNFTFTPTRLTFYFLLSLLPFLTGGAALSLTFVHCGDDVNRLYFADLVGAAAGTILAPVAIAFLAVETAIIAIGILSALAAVLLAFSLPVRRRSLCVAASFIALILTVCGTLWNYHTQILTIHDAPDKALYKLLHDHPEATVRSDRWNAYSRITCVQGFDNSLLARIFIDSDAETSVQHWDGTPEYFADGLNWFRAFPFRLSEKPSVLVIGPGGGTDVLVLSIAAGSPSVTAVEMNPLIIDCVRSLGAKAGNLYDHQKMNLVVDEGRNFIQRSQDRYDLIILGFVDSWASVASGGLALSENYLYTRDALEAYYDHLTERGALVVVRWPVDVPRLVANSVDFLRMRGMDMQDISRHVLAVSEHPPKGNEPVETVFMLSRSPLSAENVDVLLDGYTDASVIYAPSRPSQPPYEDFFSGKTSFAQYTDAFETMATPVHDDHPFYFAWDKPYGVPGFVLSLLCIPILAVVGFTALLLASAKWLGFNAPGLRATIYFTALGLGFITCEMALMQRLILLLGHPIYTLVVILFTLLLAGALGSLFAKRYTAEKIRGSLRWIILLVILLNIVAAFCLPHLVRASIHMALSARILVAGGLVFPFGFFMGMPFPLGLRKAANTPGSAPVSVFWGINGVASVVGSVAAMVLAVAAGFTWVFLLSAACYVAAWATRSR